MSLLMRTNITPELVQEIQNEITHAEQKFPGWPCDFPSAYLILAEECGEVAQAIRNVQLGKTDAAHIAHIREELIQTAAMAIRFLRMFPHMDK